MSDPLFVAKKNPMSSHGFFVEMTWSGEHMFSPSSYPCYIIHLN